MRPFILFVLFLLCLSEVDPTKIRRGRPQGPVQTGRAVNWVQQHGHFLRSETPGIGHPSATAQVNLDQTAIKTAAELQRQKQLEMQKKIKKLNKKALLLKRKRERTKARLQARKEIKNRERIARRKQKALLRKQKREKAKAATQARKAARKAARQLKRKQNKKIRKQMRKKQSQNSRKTMTTFDSGASIQPKLNTVGVVLDTESIAHANHLQSSRVDNIGNPIIDVGEHLRTDPKSGIQEVVFPDIATVFSEDPYNLHQSWRSEITLQSQPYSTDIHTLWHKNLLIDNQETPTSPIFRQFSAPAPFVQLGPMAGPDLVKPETLLPTTITHGWDRLDPRSREVVHFRPTILTDAMPGFARHEQANIEFQPGQNSLDPVEFKAIAKHDASSPSLDLADQLLSANLQDTNIADRDVAVSDQPKLGSSVNVLGTNMDATAEHIPVKDNLQTLKSHSVTGSVLNVSQQTPDSHLFSEVVQKGKTNLKILKMPGINTFPIIEFQDVLIGPNGISTAPVSSTNGKGSVNQKESLIKANETSDNLTRTADVQVDKPRSPNVSATLLPKEIPEILGLGPNKDESSLFIPINGKSEFDRNQTQSISFENIPDKNVGVPVQAQTSKSPKVTGSVSVFSQQDLGSHMFSRRDSQTVLKGKANIKFSEISETNMFPVVNFQDVLIEPNGTITTFDSSKDPSQAANQKETHITANGTSDNLAHITDSAIDKVTSPNKDVTLEPTEISSVSGMNDGKYLGSLFRELQRNLIG